MASMAAYDVIVIGGGIIGSSISLRLAQENLRVLLLESGEPGREASWAAAGMLSPAPDSPSAIPLVPFGRASLALYPQFIAEIEDLSGQSVGCRTEGTIEVIFSGDAERELSTLIALHHGLGLPTEPLPIDEARKMEPALGREARGAAFLPFEASLDTRTFVNATLAAAKSAGVEVRTHCKVTKILRDADRATGVAAENGEKLFAGEVVLAAGAYSGKIAGVTIPAKPVRGQMVALCSTEARLRRVLRSADGYVVPRNDETPQLLVAGSTLEDAGFEKRVTPQGMEKVLGAAQELAPKLAGAEIVETWCGLRPGTPDHLPLLGPADMQGLTIATGHYRNGILLAPITAKLVREWITQRRVSMDWGLFDPLRFAGAAHTRQTKTARGN